MPHSACGTPVCGAIVSTGANIFHDICEHLGVRHYKGTHLTNDEELYRNGIDRIYDVFAVEKEFQNVEHYIGDFGASLGDARLSSRAFLRLLGEKIAAERPEGRSLLAACAKHNVPVHVPALADSAIGIGLVTAYRNGAKLVIDQIADASELAAFVENAEKTGVIYLGGGTPKNFIQQTEVIPPWKMEKYIGGHAYAIQYTTDAPHWGGLSGCTFEEAVSWGKELPDAKKLQCFCDVTIALPLIVSGLIAADVVRKHD